MSNDDKARFFHQLSCLEQLMRLDEAASAGVTAGAAAVEHREGEAANGNGNENADNGSCETCQSGHAHNPHSYENSLAGLTEVQVTPFAPEPQQFEPVRQLALACEAATGYAATGQRPDSARSWNSLQAKCEQTECAAMEEVKAERILQAGEEKLQLEEELLQAIRDRARTQHRVTLRWVDIHYTVLVRRRDGTVDQKKLLDGMTGTASCGQLIAVIGPSGSGKSTFLNVLAGRAPYSSTAQLTGEILVNGAPRSIEQFRNISSYLMQDDYLFPHITVWETLWLAANFYLSADATKEEKEAVVMLVIQELGLGKAKDTIVGSDTIRGVSGGERKRTAIGVELISNPSVLFLDEPTSGLDAFQAQSVMQTMNQLAERGRLIIAAIHQPRSSIYTMFDHLMVLSEGKTMYYGPSKDAVEFFASVGFECPATYNPADYFLDTVSMDYRSPEAERETRERIRFIASEYHRYAERVEEEEGMSTRRQITLSPMSRKQIRQEKYHFRSSWANNFRTLVWRSWTEFVRDVPTLLIKYGTTIFFAIIVGLIFRDLGLNRKGVTNRLGLLFFIVLNQTFMNMMGVVHTFPSERRVVDRERSSKAYRITAYYPAKFVSDLPYNLTAPLLFGIIVYWMTNLRRTADAFFIFLAVIILQVMCATGLGLFMSCLTNDPVTTQALITPVVIILVLYGGFYIRVESLPTGTEWITYISFIRWSFQTLAINEFKNRHLDIPGINGNDVLDEWGYGDDELWQGFVGLIVFASVVHLGAFTLIQQRGPKYIKEGETGRRYTRLESKLPPKPETKEQEVTAVPAAA